LAAVTVPDPESIAHPEPTEYEKAPSLLVLGEVTFEVTVAVSPYFKVVFEYVDGLIVLDALEIVSAPLVVIAEAVYDSELVKVTNGIIEYKPANVGLSVE
jgi:hypothetical protein